MNLRRFLKFQFHGTRSLCTQKLNPTVLRDSRVPRVESHKIIPTVYPELNEKLIIKNSCFNNDFWAMSREKVLNATNLTNDIIDSVFFNTCVKANRVDAAKSYVNFLKTNNLPLNLSILGNYMQMFAHEEEVLSEEDEKQILQIYAELREKYPDLDAITASRCIIGICLTKKWKEALELLDMIRLTTTPTPTVYFAIIYAAFNNAEPDIAWEFIHQISSKVPLNERVYQTHLNYCNKNLPEKSDFVREVEKMFCFWSDNSIIPGKAILDLYLAECKRFNWLGTAITATSDMTVCKNCSIPLKPQLTDDHCQKLLNSILKKDLIGKDLYSKSTPTEFQKFLEFVERFKPFDVVIDGLNIYYGLMNALCRSRGTYSKQDILVGQKVLAELVRTLKQRGQRVLLVGRKHIWRLKSEYMKYISKSCMVFQTEDISQDDPFILYATLASGINSKFISRDMMRQHKSILQDPQMQDLFRQWQWTHQYYIHLDNKAQVVLKEPPVFHPAVTKYGDFWHMPVVPAETFSRMRTSEPPSKWICLKHHSNE